MSLRLGFLGFSVGAAAVLAFTAGASEVKGPVHITGNGVELVTPAEFAANDDSGSDRRAAAREASAAAREAIAEGRRAAREAENEAREAAAEARAETAEAAADARRDAEEAAREARDEAMSQVREARAAAMDIAREARAHSRVAVKFALLDLPVLAAGIRVEIHKAMEDVSDARLDLVQSAQQLAAVKAGDFSDIVIVSKGEMKCGDVAAHPGCVPLSEADKARMTKTMDAALESAANAVEAAHDGLAAAARAEADGATP